ncbi:lysozyme [Aquariibacter albus]|uniref:Lysozyme n=1 Tax=Aquariibacter albus TaxID=2759899 RepID=A0A839HHZ7_9BURK|nr:lysozyme [Aquariibacter albus]MBB1161443.1 lysozyme [Aquariibacter albus]
MSTAAATQQSMDLAAGLCRHFEGFIAHPYLCPAGVPTIGYGSTRYADGTPVRLTDPPICREAAERLLRLTLTRDYLPAVRQLCPGVDTPGRLAALVDFAYNCGTGNLKASTLRRKVNAEDWDAVPTELRKWTRGGGRVLPGLVRRREAEVALLTSR